MKWGFLRYLVFLLLFLLVSFVVFGQPRDVCADVGNDVDVLCWRNDTVNISTIDVYNVTYHFSDRVDKWQNQFHYSAGDFIFDNPDDLDLFANGGFGRVRYRSYGNVFNGYRMQGGSIGDKRWTPFKWMATNSITFPFNAKSEVEITGDRRYLVLRGAYECEDSDGCDFAERDHINLQMSNIVGSVKPTWDTDIDGLYCGNRFNLSVAGDENDPSLFREFLVAVSPCPDNHGEDAGVANVSFDVGQDEVVNVTIVVTTKEFEDGIDSWVANYSDNLRNVSVDFENYARAFNVPDHGRYNESEIINYYNAVYTSWFSTFREWNDSNSSHNFFVLGENRDVIAPYDYGIGLWVWDSFNTGLGLISAINFSSESVGNVTSLIEDDIFIRVENMKKWDVGKWNRTIHWDSYTTGDTQPLGGYSLYSINAYNNSIINQSYLCNSTLGVLETHYKGFKDNNRLAGTSLYGDTTNNMGRDGTDIIDGSNPNPDTTAFAMLDAISISEIASVCGNSTLSSDRYKDYLDIKNNMSLLYDDTNDVYSAYTSGEAFYYFGAVTANWASSPFGQCMPIALNATNQSTSELLSNKLYNNFTDLWGYTSIPTHHVSYEADGLGSGDSWNGPVWGGVDNFYCLNAWRQANDTYLFGLGENESWLADQNVLMYGGQNTFGVESWHSNSVDPASRSEWDSEPYHWGANVMFSSVNDYNIFEPLTLLQSGEPEGEPEPEVVVYKSVVKRMYKFAMKTGSKFVIR